MTVWLGTWRSYSKWFDKKKKEKGKNEQSLDVMSYLIRKVLRLMLLLVPLQVNQLIVRSISVLQKFRMCSLLYYFTILQH